MPLSKRNVASVVANLDTDDGRCVSFSLNMIQIREHQAHCCFHEILLCGCQRQRKVDFVETTARHTATTQSSHVSSLFTG